MPSQKVGEPIPLNTTHAVSVTLPTWEATVGYEEGQEWVTSQMNSGYPRFFIHSVIQELEKQIINKYGRDGERCLIFPSYKAAKRCREFIKSHSDKESVQVRILQLSTPAPKTEEEKSYLTEATIAACLFPASEFSLAKNYWQHSGEGISSRLGEYCLRELFIKDKDENIDPSSKLLANSNLKQEIQAQAIQKKSPSISFKTSNSDETFYESESYIDEKFGRILDLKFADQAKAALRKRICGNVEDSAGEANSERSGHLDPSDVYLYPSGMASIFHAHNTLLHVLSPKKSVCFGFPYVDTLNILKKFGPGVHFLGLGDDKSLDELEDNLVNGKVDIMALFCECPSNPLLKTPNLKRIRKLADQYDFAVVVDETIGNFLNIHVLPYSDIVASSLTKVFSGDSNVMGGSLILNPQSRYYNKVKKYFDEEYEDLFWAMDALHLERNSRDFVERSAKINDTTAAVVDMLTLSPLIAKVYYPRLDSTKKYYDEVKTKHGGYGGLISFLFKDPSDAVCFFNAVNIYKGPSLGTNFTLASPYAILAHYQELDEIAKWDVDRNLIRVSVGLEDKDELLGVFEKALSVAKSNHN
ncbi:uncharacterized protein PRCAT00003760001 [Priceomyces carsonii]|uniref:uncharacterized protein n=1 Tax=Priceomyces carsonii TaxID=28549 RepID=UPI002ED813FD|nr:unnamed protein product [Priceomyces carsonii]